MRLVALVLAAALALPARAEPAPQPPADHPSRVIAGGTVVQLLPPDLGAPVATTVPAAGALYLDPDAWAYQVNLRRWTELNLKICKDQVENTPPGGWKPWVAAGVAGLVVGAIAGGLAVRAAR